MVPDVNSHKKSRFQVVANFRAHWNVTMYKMQVRQRIIIDKKEIKLNYIYVLYVHIWECLWESNIHVWSPLICSRSEMKEVSKLSGFRLYQFDNDLLTIYWFDMKNVISFSLTCLFCYLHWFAKTEVLEGHQTNRFISVHTESPHLSNWSWSLRTAERHRSFVIPLLTWNLQAAAGYEKKIQPSRGHIRMSQSLTRQISVLHVMAIWRICTSITLSLIYLTSLHKSCVQ